MSWKLSLIFSTNSLHEIVILNSSWINGTRGLPTHPLAVNISDMYIILQWHHTGVIVYQITGHLIIMTYHRLHTRLWYLQLLFGVSICIINSKLKTITAWNYLTMSKFPVIHVSAPAPAQYPFVKTATSLSLVAVTLTVQCDTCLGTSWCSQFYNIPVYQLFYP